MIKLRGLEMFYESKAYLVLENGTSGTAKKVMLSILKLMERDLNYIVINGKTLDTMTETLSISKQQVRDAVSELKKLKLIEPTNRLRAEYVVNPTLAIKGDVLKVWKFYGEIERDNGNSKVTVVNNEYVVLDGKSVELTEEDLKEIGKFVIKGRK